MTDTGLVASLLRWQFDKVRLDADQSGKLVEGFVFAQLAAQIDAQEDTYSLSHYRDREQREIDFVIETPDGMSIGIEVKAWCFSGSIDDDKRKSASSSTLRTPRVCYVWFGAQCCGGR